MAQALRSNPNVDPTLVTLRVYTTTPELPSGVKTREDFQLVIETNSIVLPRDVTVLLRNPVFNHDPYGLGFKEVSFQNTVGVQMGTIDCGARLQPEGAHPWCIEHTPGMGRDWNFYYRWPNDYVVPRTATSGAER